MKKLNNIIYLIIGLALLSSCEVKKSQFVTDLEGGPILATFESFNINLVALANGDEYDRTIRVKIQGPGFRDLTSDLTVTVAPAAASTAVENQHYRMENKTITLRADNNHLALLDIVMLTAGNSPPQEGTPEYEDYVAPRLILEISEVSGNSKVIASGKPANIVLNFVPPNPYEGDYEAYLRYYHPTAGGSHPSFPDWDPSDPFVEEVNLKTLRAITGRTCETGFATWYDTDICWITVNVDNSITFEVDVTWPYDVTLGDPYDPSLISHFDPETRMIYLYYNYVGTGGTRIFWEEFTPLFEPAE